MSYHSQQGLCLLGHVGCVSVTQLCSLHGGMSSAQHVPGTFCPGALVLVSFDYSLSPQFSALQAL